MTEGGHLFKESQITPFSFEWIIFRGISSFHKMKRICRIRFLDYNLLFYIMLPVLLLSCGSKEVPDPDISGVWESPRIRLGIPH